jgi:hypothetical protein
LPSDAYTLLRAAAVLIPPATRRATRNDGDEPAAFLLMSVKVTDHAAESQRHDAFWR